MKSFERKDRVSAQLKRELARMLQTASKDPRFAMVTITEIRVSPDLSVAKVYLTVLDESQKQETLKALVKAEGHLRKALDKKMRLRRVPVLNFVYDEAIARSAHITALIDRALAEDEGAQQKREESSDDDDTSRA